MVVVHWNQPRRCVRTVRRFLSTTPEIGVVVVDNSSPPEARAHLRQELPEVPLITEVTNRGFGPAANQGLRWWLEREVPFLVVAPHDALVADDCLDRMVQAFEERPGAGLASADVGDDRTPVIDPYFGGISRPAEVREGWEEADHPHGTLLMARRECLLDIGLFDERYFAYCEEAELGLRARRAGWEVGLVRGAMVHNPTMRSGSAAVDYLQHRNTLLLVREASGAYHVTIRLLILLGACVVGLLAPSRRPALFAPRARLRAALDFLLGRYGPPPPGYFETFDPYGEPEGRR